MSTQNRSISRARPRQPTAYPAQSGRYPILGALLTGSRKEGVFAANYSVTGSLDDPDFEINPLSALAPGILREIFDAAPVEHSAEAPLNPNERDDP